MKFFVTGDSFEKNQNKPVSYLMNTMEGNSKVNPLWLPVKEPTCQRPTKEQEMELDIRKKYFIVSVARH